MKSCLGEMSRWKTDSPIKSTMIYAINGDLEQSEMCIIFDNDGKKTVEKKPIKQMDEEYNTIKSILRGDVEKLSEIFLISYNQNKIGWKLFLKSKMKI